MEKIGNVCEIPGERIIEWKIKNFFSLHHAINTCYDSPDFYFSDISWNLRLYPNGEERNNSHGFLGVYLARMPSGASVILDYYSIVLKSTDRNKDIVKRATSTVFDKVKRGNGFDKLIPRSILMERQCDLAPFDEITIICTMKNNLPNVTGIAEDKCIQTASYLNADLSKESLPKDFSELLNTGLYQDVEMKCGEHSIKVHKIVLCARSDVFKAMLQSDMQESQTGVVAIQDMDVSYFKDFVRYLYTDEMPELTFDEVKQLYETGDKYNVKSLVLRCSKYFQDNLSEGNIFQCFALADAHSDAKLKDKIITYILQEKVYLQDEYWSPFYENYPHIALKVYKLSYKKSKEE